MPLLALIAGGGLIALEWRSEASTFWIIVGGAMIVLALAALLLPQTPADR